MPVAPTLTDEQRKLAAKRSLELRQQRADLKREVALLGVSFFKACFNPLFIHAADVQGMKVYDLLTALPGIGRAKALKVLAEARIPEKNTVRACGPKQRERLFSLLG
jgi:hypothetical protein